MFWRIHALSALWSLRRCPSSRQHFETRTAISLCAPTQQPDECNASSILDGTIPFPLANNTYMSGSGGYVMRCKADALNFSQAQALGVDLGSRVTTLPSVDALVAMGHDVLQF
jgi:hypothetical protein